MRSNVAISFRRTFHNNSLAIGVIVSIVTGVNFGGLALTSDSLDSYRTPLMRRVHRNIIAHVCASNLHNPLTRRVSHNLLTRPIRVRSRNNHIRLMRDNRLGVSITFLNIPSYSRFNGTGNCANGTYYNSLNCTVISTSGTGRIIVLARRLLPCPRGPTDVRRSRISLVIGISHINSTTGVNTNTAHVAAGPHRLLVTHDTTSIVIGSNCFGRNFSVRANANNTSLTMAHFLRSGVHDHSVHTSFTLNNVATAVISLRRGNLVHGLLSIRDFSDRTTRSLTHGPGRVRVDTGRCTG